MFQITIVQDFGDEVILSDGGIYVDASYGYANQGMTTFLAPSYTIPDYYRSGCFNVDLALLKSHWSST
jgi:hypothetical protein